MPVARPIVHTVAPDSPEYIDFLRVSWDTTRNTTSPRLEVAQHLKGPLDARTIYIPVKQIFRKSLMLSFRLFPFL